MSHRAGQYTFNEVTMRPFLESVRKAEHLLAAGEHELALQKLREAQAVEPRNRYIPALIQRVEDLRKSASGRVAPLPPRVMEAILPSPRQEPSGPESPTELQVRRLTTVATNLYHRGAFQTAFQTLVKAFQLSPTSPYVIECQKTLRPALETLRQGGGLLDVNFPVHDPAELFPQHRGTKPTDAPLAHPSENERDIRDSVPSAQENRLEALKRQKDLERRERELAMWREASKPPRLYGKRIENAPEKQHARASAKDAKQQKGFFAKLRHGRLLG